MCIGHAEIVAELSELDIIGTDRDKWLALRSYGIGGSDIGKLVGASRYGSPLSVYRSKVDGEDDPAGKAARMGTRLEHIVADEYEAMTGVSINEPRVMVRHPEFPWMLANIDRVRDDDQRIVEIKCRRNNWTDGVPLDVELQCRQYMCVTGIERCDVAVLFGGIDVIVFELERDEGIESSLIELQRDFWHQHVLAQNPPAAIGSDSERLGSYFPGDGSTMTATPQLAQLVEDKVRRAERMKLLKEEMAKTDAAIKEAMGDAVELLDPEGKSKLVNWSASKKTLKLDVEALTAAHPAIVAEFMNETTTSRRLSLSSGATNKGN